MGHSEHALGMHGSTGTSLEADCFKWVGQINLFANKTKQSQNGKWPKVAAGFL